MTNLISFIFQPISGYKDLMIIAFCIPPAGLLLYFVNRVNMPDKAKSLAYIAILGSVIRVIINYLYVLSFSSI